MAEAALKLKEEPAVAPAVRRFELADMDRHGAWLLPRLQQAFPHLNDRALVGFLRGIMENNEFLFLYADNACALAQLSLAHTLQPKPLVWERWVWARDPKEQACVEQAAYMYDRFRDWATALGAQTIIVEEMSDVPHELVRQHLGRILTRQQQFVRL